MECNGGKDGALVVMSAGTVAKSTATSDERAKSPREPRPQAQLLLNKDIERFRTSEGTIRGAENCVSVGRTTQRRMTRKGGDEGIPTPRNLRGSIS